MSENKPNQELEEELAVLDRMLELRPDLADDIQRQREQLLSGKKPKKLSPLRSLARWLAAPFLIVLGIVATILIVAALALGAAIDLVCDAFRREDSQ